MNTTMRSIALGAGVALVLIGGFFAYQQFFNDTYTVPDPGERYVNNEHRFRVTMPVGFSAREVDGAVVIENGSGDGVQILMTPLGEDIQDLTEERIKADIPDLVISGSERVEVGEKHTGLAFKSDNQAFDGASREVWFVYGGMLYQISTYDRLDPLLRAMFGTWEFF